MGGMPTLSQVENWDIDHLTEAATHWTATANVWEDRFSQLATRILNPGGTPWEGKAAEAAQQRAYSDRMTVIGLADQLHDAAAIAKAGVTELAEARRLVLRTVGAAKSAGFTVGEDFSVTDHHVYNRAAAAMRQAQAEGFAADLRATVAALVAADDRIATQLTTATAGLGIDPFAEAGGAAGAREGGDQKAVTDTLLGNAADGTPAAEAKGKPAHFDWVPDGTNRSFMATGAVVDGTTDAVRKAAVEAMKDGARTGPGSASPALAKFLDDAKIAGRTMKGVSGVGGVMSAVMVVPNAIADHGQGDSWLKAFGKEGGGTLTGVAAGAMAGAAFGSAAPVVGTVVGLAVGAVVGYLATEGLDTYWEPLADGVGSAVHGVESAANAVGGVFSSAARGVASVFSFG